MYAKGDGVPANNVRAYMWWSLAKAQDQVKAAGNLKILRERMTPTQIAEAQALATEMWEKINN